MKVLGEIPQGADWCIFNGKIIVACPDRNPYILNEDGTETEIALNELQELPTTPKS